MTYLDLINKVLRELRESTVTTISTDYSRLIGQFVNAAKDEIEDSWKWKWLRADRTFPTAIGVTSYLISSTNERSYLLKDTRARPMVFDMSTNSQFQLYSMGLEEHRRLLATDNGNQRGQPSFVASNRGPGGVYLKLWCPPDAVRTMQATLIVPQDDLEDEDDILLIPSRPVWLRAAAYAAAERSEGMGMDVGRLEARADLAQRNAIAFDAESEEVDFQVI